MAVKTDVHSLLSDWQGQTTPRVKRLKEQIFSREGTFFQRHILWAEALRKLQTEHRPEVRHAQALQHLLSNMTIAIGDDELIVGLHPLGVPAPREKRRLSAAHRYLRSQPSETVGGWGGHQALNNERILADGLERYRERIQEKLASLNPADSPEDVEREWFYTGALIALEALTEFILRYADAAARLRSETSNRRRRRELAEIERVCRHIAHQPAATLREAIQLAWFVHLVVCAESGEYHSCFCPGRLDHYFYPYYQADWEAGRITPQEAQELIDCYLLKLNEFGTIRSQTIQMIMIGGQTREGNDNTNDISFIVLDSYRRLGIREPSLSLSWHARISQDLMLRCCEMLSRGATYPAIFNDEVIVPAMVANGVDPADAYHYNPGSCVELTICGRSKSFFVAHYVNLPLWLLLTLWNGKDPSTGEPCGLATGPTDGLKTFEQFLAAFKRQMAHMLRENALAVNRQQALMRQHIRRPLCSCFIEDCIEKGNDIENGGSRYVFTEPQGVGFSTLVDSLLAIKCLVYERKEIGLAEFRDLLAQDFEGQEPLRQRITHKLPKFGTDNEEADALAAELVEHFSDEVEKHQPFAGGRYHPGFLGYVVHYHFGEKTIATPDGRKVHQPLSDSLGPAQGRGTTPTAAIRSITKFPHSRLLGGLVLNLKFSAQGLQGPTGFRKLRDLLTTYFDLGGLQVQVNVIDTETLRQAQERPEQYRDLLVRVAGFSAYFTDLSPEMQEEIISRTTY